MSNSLTTTQPQCFPASTKQALRLIKQNSSGQWEFSEPSLIDDELRESTRLAVFHVEKLLTASTPDMISARVSALMLHYFKEKLPEKAFEHIAKDWIAALKSYPYWAIDNACTDYVATDAKGRKPTPGMVALLCDRLTSKHHAMLRAAMRLSSLPNTPKRTEIDEEGRARIAEMLKQTREKIAGTNSND